MRVDMGLHGAELGFLLLDHELPFLQLGILHLPDQPLQLSRHAVEALKDRGHFIVAEPVHMGGKNKIAPLDPGHQLLQRWRAALSRTRKTANKRQCDN